MDNSAMKAGRYAHWHAARKRVAFIAEHLTAGHTVVIATMTKATQFDRRHIAMFKATKSGAFVQRGKHWDCIDYCAIKAF